MNSKKTDYPITSVLEVSQVVKSFMVAAITLSNWDTFAGSAEILFVVTGVTITTITDSSSSVVIHLYDDDDVQISDTEYL